MLPAIVEQHLSRSARLGMAFDSFRSYRGQGMVEVFFQHSRLIVFLIFPTVFDSCVVLFFFIVIDSCVVSVL